MPILLLWMQFSVPPEAVVAEFPMLRAALPQRLALEWLQPRDSC